jgi:hypothetical protein
MARYLAAQRAILDAVTITDDRRARYVDGLARVEGEERRLRRRRNFIAHANWYVGWGNEHTQDWSEAEGVTLKGDGSKVAKETITAADLDQLVDDALVLGQLVLDIGLTLHADNLGIEF